MVDIVQKEDEDNLNLKIKIKNFISIFNLDFDKMGRKIPGRKHRGVKDPEQQAAARLISVKDKINAPPTDPDVQEVSKSLQRIINLKNKTKSGDFSIKKKLKTIKESEENESKPKEKKLVDPLFQQQPNESDRTFLFRVNKICENVRREAAFADKYGVEIKRDAAGEVKVVKREKDELELLIKKVKKEKAKKKTKKKNVESDSPKLTKSQKWEKKKKEKKLQKRLKSADEFEPVKDTVKFGEIAHAPPTLTLPKKVGKVTPRPGGKKLLLSAIVLKSAEESKRQPVKEKEKLQKVTKKTIDKKGKRKDLPNAVRRQLDTQQKEVIGAYKRLKAKKRSDS